MRREPDLIDGAVEVLLNIRPNVVEGHVESVGFYADRYGGKNASENVLAPLGFPNTSQYFFSSLLAPLICGGIVVARTVDDVVAEVVVEVGIVLVFAVRV